MRKTAAGPVVEPGLFGLFQTHVAEHITGAAKVGGHRVHSGHHQAVRHFDAQADSLVIPVDSLHGIDNVEHKNVLVGHGGDDVEHGAGQSAGLFYFIGPVGISFRQAGGRVHLRDPDLMGDAALHSRDGPVGRSVLPGTTIRTGDFHGIESDPQVFDHIGEKGLGMDLEPGKVNQNTPGIKRPVSGIGRVAAHDDFVEDERLEIFTGRDRDLPAFGRIVANPVQVVDHELIPHLSGGNVNSGHALLQTLHRIIPQGGIGNLGQVFADEIETPASVKFVGPALNDRLGGHRSPGLLDITIIGRHAGQGRGRLSEAHLKKANARPVVEPAHHRGHKGPFRIAAAADGRPKMIRVDVLGAHQVRFEEQLLSLLEAFMDDGQKVRLFLQGG